MSSVILLSGGLDSATLAAWAQQTRDSTLIAVSFNYGQKHTRELLAARRVAEYFQMPHDILAVDPLIFKGAQSTLVGDMLPNPHMTYEELAQAQGVSPTYVPYRNAIFISMATAVAMTVGAEEVLIGVHAEDARNWAYPDCSPEFIGAQAAAIYVGTYHKVRLIAPFQFWTKPHIVKYGLELNVPYHLTWSCYEGHSTPCHQCPTCVEREMAFATNGAKDPLNDPPWNQKHFQVKHDPNPY